MGIRTRQQTFAEKFDQMPSCGISLSFNPTTIFGQLREAKVVLALFFTRFFSKKSEGMGIRTPVGTKPTDLESVPFGRSGIPSGRSEMIFV
jgi:hypothetical protein